MLIKKPDDTSSSEITGKHLYFDRRKFLAGATTLAGAAAIGAAFPLPAEAGEKLSGVVKASSALTAAS